MSWTPSNWLRAKGWLVLTLILSLLSLPHVSAHAHLSQNHHDHHHDGFHTHEIETHFHALTQHYSDQDADHHHADISNTVDLEQNFSLSSWSQPQLDWHTLPSDDLALPPLTFKPEHPAFYQSPLLRPPPPPFDIHAHRRIFLKPID